MASMFSGIGGGVQSGMEMKMQARIYEAQAQTVEERTKYGETQAQRELKAIKGRQRVLYAKAGVELSEGTPVEMLASTARQGEFEIEGIRYAGEEQARQLRWYKRIARKNAQKVAMAQGSSGFISGLGEGFGYYSSLSGGGDDSGKTYLTGINYSAGPSTAGATGFSIGGGWGRY